MLILLQLWHAQPLENQNVENAKDMLIAKFASIVLSCVVNVGFLSSSFVWYDLMLVLCNQLLRLRSATNSGGFYRSDSRLWCRI